MKPLMKKRIGGDFLCLTRMDSRTLRTILDIAIKMKKKRKTEQFLSGKILAMIFDKPSTRTRVSFDVAMRQLGGAITALSGQEMQLGRGESIEDTAKVLSRYVNIIMIRTAEEQRLLDMAEHATVPVINGLTDDSHPCQIMADMMTFEEHRGSIKGKKIAWLGDGNNVSASLAHAARHFGFELHLAVPEARLGFLDKAVKWANQDNQCVHISATAQDAAQGAHAVVTDTWVSMGDNADNGNGGGEVNSFFMPYQVNAGIMRQANADAVFMHCLPAHRGEEVTAEVMDGAQSIVWDEAENRLHVQKSIILVVSGWQTWFAIAEPLFREQEEKTTSPSCCVTRTPCLHGGKPLIRYPIRQIIILDCFYSLI